MVLKPFKRVFAHRLLAGSLLLGLFGLGLSCSGETDRSSVSNETNGGVQSSNLNSSPGSHAEGKTSESEEGAELERAESNFSTTSVANPGSQASSFELLKPSGFGSFDLMDSGSRAAATIPGLGDVAVTKTGRLRIQPAATIASEEQGSTDRDWRYSSRLEKVTLGASEDQRVVRLSEPTSNKLDAGTIRQRFEEGLTVKYENRTRGLKQGLEISNEFDGADEIRLYWTIPPDFSLEKRDDGSVLASSEGQKRFAWRNLLVRSADGTELASSMQVSSEALIYEIQTEGASFPLEVDPLATSPSFDESRSQQGSLFGQNVASAGDVNNDGYTDLLVSQTGYNDSGTTSAGRAYLYLGSSTGTSNTAAWDEKGETSEEFYGISTGIGDINGDGNDDVVASGFRWISGGDDLGRVELFLGGASGTGLKTTAAQPQLEGTQADQFFGRQLAGGDFNCDGTPDVAVGSPGWDGSATDSGRIYIFFGSSSAPYFPTTPSWTYTPSKTGFLGQDVENAGDVNNDGCDDLIAGGHEYPDSNGNPSGIAMVFLGSSGGPAKPPAWEEVGPDGSEFGKRVTEAGDINGDGFDDIAVGGRLANSGGGLVRVYYGDSGGIQNSIAWSDSGSNDAKLGSGLSSGDVNDDGTPDLAVGAVDELDPQTGNRLGSVRLYLGKPSGGLTQNSLWKDFSDDSGSLFGFTTAILDDVNTNPPKESDLFVGAALHKNQMGQTTAGKVFGYYGKPTCYINNNLYADGDKNPNNSCEICDPATPTSWSDVSMGTTCNDGDACTKNTTCDGNGNCTGQPVTCDDGKSCTRDFCDSNNGCQVEVTTGCLIDGNCVSKGAQKNEDAGACEQCVPSQDKRAYTQVSAGTSCDDGDFCTVNTTCDASGVCDGPDRDCADYAGPKEANCHNSYECDSFVGRCRPQNPKADGTPCNDGSACTEDTKCQNGLCTGGDTVSCDPCEECDPQGAPNNCSVTLTNGESCNPDDDVCTIQTCNSMGQCTQQSTEQCDDGNPCTVDGPMLCDPQSGCPDDPPTQPKQGTACGDPSCNDSGNLVQAPVCDDSGNCLTDEVMTQDCGAYNCRAVQGTPTCPEACTSNGQCKSGNYCFDRPDDEDGDKECHDNRPPEADTGNDQGGVGEGDIVSLDGSQSRDPDNQDDNPNNDDQLNYQWQLVEVRCPGDGSADLQAYRDHLANDAEWDPNAEKPQFTAMAPQCDEEILTFELVVNDGEFDSEPEETEVRYGDCDQSPRARFDGLPLRANWGDTFTLDASESSPGCGAEITEYSWSTRPDTPAVSLEKNGAELEVELPDVCREQEFDYIFSLTVFDGIQNSQPAEDEVIVRPNGPCEGDGVAEPGPDVGTDAADGGAELRGDLSGSSCGGCSAGSEESPTVPTSLVVFAMVGWAIRMRRRN